MKAEQKMFSCLDIFLASFLELRGLHSTLEKSNGSGRVVFTFPQSEELYRLMSDFNSDESVPAASYASAIRTLRARMFAMRQG